MGDSLIDNNYHDSVAHMENLYTEIRKTVLTDEKVEEMINDKETVNLNQIRYENHIQEWYKFIVEKKELIEKNS